MGKKKVFDEVLAPESFERITSRLVPGVTEQPLELVFDSLAYESVYFVCTIIDAVRMKTGHVLQRWTIIKGRGFPVTVPLISPQGCLLIYHAIINQQIHTGLILLTDL